MRTCLIMVFALLAVVHCRGGSGEISGTVLDEKKMPVIGAVISVSSAGIVRAQTATDYDGIFVVSPLPAGSNYELMVTYKGYVTQIVKNIIVRDGSATKVHIHLAPDLHELKEVVITTYKTPLIEIGHPHNTLDAGIRHTGITNTADLVSVASPCVHVRHGESEAFGGRGSTTTFIIDGVEDHATAAPAEKHGGRLTSGEVNDFSKWKLWKDLSKGELSMYSNIWSMLPRHRYTVLLKSKDNTPLCNARVLLRDKATDSVLWAAVTDNTGKAELWDRMFTDSNKDHRIYAELRYRGERYKIRNLRPFSKRINVLNLPFPCDAPKGLDVAFIVDATGSMQDEINYLKEELYDVINKVKDSLHEHEVRLGAVFYRDHGDDYLTKVSALDNNIKTTVDFIKNNNAGGGGDGPEAVDDALDAALNRLEWNKDALARIAFLVLDAPPHDQAEVVTRVHDLVYEYAKRGIRLVPVVCSGSDKSNEYLMRSLALATNGTFIFLTDHSGIGGHHTEASTDKYDVSFVNELIFRTICQFAYSTPCDQAMMQIADTLKMSNEPAKDSLVKLAKDTVKSDTSKYVHMKFYPNPTDRILYTEYENVKGNIYVSDISGKLILKTEADKGGKMEIDMFDFPSGIYFIKYEDEKGVWLSGKFILLR